MKRTRGLSISIVGQRTTKPRAQAEVAPAEAARPENSSEPKATGPLRNPVLGLTFVNSKVNKANFVLVRKSAKLTPMGEAVTS